MQIRQFGAEAPNQKRWRIAGLGFLFAWAPSKMRDRSCPVGTSGPPAQAVCSLRNEYWK
jgi:hypothetical protein